MGLNQLVDKIRAAYPGAYDDMDDAALTKAVLGKYPQYSDLAAPPIAKPPNAIEQDLAKSRAVVQQAGPFTEPGAAEEAIGRGGSPMDYVKAPAMGANFAAPVLTGGASLPIQALVQGGAAAADTAAQGGTAKQTLTSGAIGAAIPAAAEGLSLAGQKAAQLIPSAENAGKGFQEVMSVAGKHTVDVSDAGNAALRIQQLAERGGTMPKVVRNFLSRVTDPAKGPLTFEESRDFYSNASRLSADEAKRLTPRLRFEVTKFVQALGDANEQAAAQAGKYDTFMNAMNEYKNAMRLRGAVENAKDLAIKYVPYVGGAYAAKKLIEGK